MSSKGQSISAASIDVKSTVRAKNITPASATSVGFRIGKEEAILLARNLLVLACSHEWQGDIVVTGHVEDDCITVLRYKKGRSQATREDSVGV
jgi:hypothetical protein